VLTKPATVVMFRLLAKCQSMRSILNITKALADENRLRMLLALRRHELCVCQITALMGLAMSTVSKHLSILYQAGLVNARKEGRWMYYSLPGKGVPTAAREAVAWVRRSLADSERVAEDAKRLKKVLAMDLTELCKRQCGN
jgi:ArsR family transcriptional regulator